MSRVPARMAWSRGKLGRFGEGSVSRAMDVEQVRRLLIRAKTSEERADAVRRAVQEGVPLWRVEMLLDWIDQALATNGTLDSLDSSAHNETTGASKRDDMDPRAAPERSEESD